jgi:predicted dienelactone hydrolase
MAMRRFGLVVTLGLGLFFLYACSSTATEPTVTMLQDKATSTTASQTTIPPRNSREIELLIWYPAKTQTDANGRSIVRDAVPDLSGAPYPVILTEKDTGGTVFLSHLATHGLVFVVVKSLKSARGEEFNWIQYARDFLFSLDRISSTIPEGLENLLDTDRVGVTGFSYGGDVSLAMSGARIDPDFYLSQCSQMTTLVPATLQWVYTDWVCLDYSHWDAFVSYAGEEITSSEDGLWQPMADPRIRAVMPMAPSVSWYYGERGLAAVDRPTLILWGTKDDLASYEFEAEYTFGNIGTPDRFLISFVGRTHSMTFAEDAILRMRHFATAFFGYYLQGREDYAEYFSEDFVTQFDDLAWGLYSNE